MKEKIKYLFFTLFQARLCVFIRVVFYLSNSRIHWFFRIPEHFFSVYNVDLSWSQLLENWCMVEHWIQPTIWIVLEAPHKVFVSLVTWVNLRGCNCMNKTMLREIENSNICTCNLLVPLFILLQRMGQRTGFKEKSQTH